ncbi:unnamed protein product [Musa acuminata var. zebrina]
MVSSCLCSSTSFQLFFVVVVLLAANAWEEHDIKDSFFGADSLNMVEIVMCTEEQFGINIEEDNSQNHHQGSRSSRTDREAAG